ncbi:unnamed protein product [Caenorhabditis bovis]|uniref:EGF-like domain-containing protein n=1 Tax=Caenorhabditis bovis TaxID=2654633 RepID=A0A8S1F5Q7_9PELO|nr:unnamed protein product [Caenorhabditis bovis]
MMPTDGSSKLWAWLEMQKWNRMEENGLSRRLDERGMRNNLRGFQTNGSIFRRKSIQNTLDVITILALFFLKELENKEAEQFRSFILPKTPADVTFNDTIATLKKLFNQTKSLARLRYELFSVKFDGVDRNDYTALVKRRFASAQWNQLLPDQAECLLWIIGLHASEHLDLRIWALRELELNPELKLTELTDRLDGIASCHTKQSATAVTRRDISQKYVAKDNHATNWPNSDACTKENEVCVNSVGSFRCDCAADHKRDDKNNCVLDIEAPPYRSIVPPDQLLRFISMSSLVFIITFVVWYRSPLLYVLTAIAVVALILVDLYINPQSVPDEAKRFLGY